MGRHRIRGMKGYPIIVIGPPRSGTTMVARVLQEWFGVLMDGKPMRSDKTINPYGWFEDSRLAEASNLLLQGVISGSAWDRRFKRFIHSMQKRSHVWGFKDPRMVPFFGHVLSFFETRTIIRCHRSKKLVVESYKSKLGWTEEESNFRYDRDERMLDEQLKYIPHFRIDFENNVREEDVIELFRSNMVLRDAA